MFSDSCGQLSNCTSYQEKHSRLYSFGVTGLSYPPHALPIWQKYSCIVQNHVVGHRELESKLTVVKLAQSSSVNERQPQYACAGLESRNLSRKKESCSSGNWREEQTDSVRGKWWVEIVEICDIVKLYLCFFRFSFLQCGFEPPLHYRHDPGGCAVSWMMIAWCTDWETFPFSGR